MELLKRVAVSAFVLSMGSALIGCENMGQRDDPGTSSVPGGYESGSPAAGTPRYPGGAGAGPSSGSQ